MGCYTRTINSSIQHLRADNSGFFFIAHDRGQARPRPSDWRDPV